MIQNFSAAHHAVVQWGNVPAWFSSVGTVLAFMLAFLLGLRGVRNDRARRRDDELRQARLVILSEPSSPFVSKRRGPVIAVRVMNYSDQPIHEASVSMQVWRAGEHGDRRPSEDEVPSESSEWAFLGPHKERETKFEIPEGTGDVYQSSPKLEFLDSFGRRWERNVSWPEPRRILDRPQLAIEFVDGEPRVVAVQPKSMLKKLLYKLPFMRKQGNPQYLLGNRTEYIYSNKPPSSSL